MQLTSKQSALRAAYIEAGQGHVFDFFDLLTEDEQNALMQQLAALPTPTALANMFEAATASSAAAAESQSITAPAADEVVKLPQDALDEDSEKVAAFRKAGLAAIKDGKTATLILAGGQGSRLGAAVPKGTISIGLPSDATLFELLFQRHLKAVEMAVGAPVEGGGGRTAPIVVMTSPATHADTIAFLKEKECFGAGALAVAPYSAAEIKECGVFVFQQGVLPAFSEDGKVLLASPGAVAVAPDGNGGLWTSASWRRLVEGLAAERGLAYVHTVNVDNALCRVLDPLHIGAAVVGEHEIVAKVVPKASPTEAVGVFAKKSSATTSGGAGWGVVEYSEMTDSQKSDESLAVGANVGMYVFSVPFITKAMDACALPSSAPSPATAAAASSKEDNEGKEGSTEEKEEANGAESVEVCPLHAARGKKTGTIRRGSVTIMECPPTLSGAEALALAEKKKKAKKAKDAADKARGKVSAAEEAEGKGSVDAALVEKTEARFVEGLERETVGATKLERFIFDPFPLAKSFLLVSCVREAEFAPVKAADGGSSPDTPKRARELVLGLHSRWVKMDGEAKEGTVEVKPSLSYSGEGAPFEASTCGVVRATA